MSTISKKRKIGWKWVKYWIFPMFPSKKKLWNKLC